MMEAVARHVRRRTRVPKQRQQFDKLLESRFDRLPCCDEYYCQQARLKKHRIRYEMDQTTIQKKAQYISEANKGTLTLRIIPS